MDISDIASYLIFCGMVLAALSFLSARAKEKTKEREKRGGGMRYGHGQPREPRITDKWWFWVIVIILMVGVITLPFSIVIIDQTDVGVVKVFGKVNEGELGAGLHFIIPLIMSVDRFPVFEKTIEFADVEDATAGTIKALTSEGLSVEFDLAIQYMIDPERADEVYSNLKNYEVWMTSRIRAKVRDLIAEYKAEDLYSEARMEVQRQFERTLIPEFGEYGIIVTAVLIRNIDLPDSIEIAIQMKIEEKQEAERMVFTIQREERERERKIIEADGISKANEIIAESLTTNYLRWYWIQNLEEHESVIYVPIGEGGLPLFREI